MGVSCAVGGAGVTGSVEAAASPDVAADGAGVAATGAPVVGAAALFVGVDGA